MGMTMYLYYKHVINYVSSNVALALARKVNYDRKVSCTFKCTFIIVIYDCNTLIVQAIEHQSRR
jgi:hypothetical protein